MGFGGFLKKAAKKGASVALKGAVQTASGGVGGLAVGAIKMATNKKERVGQIKGALVGAVAGDKVGAIAELLDDVASLGRLVKEARADDTITPDELKMILDAVEELEEDAQKALKKLF
jgi:hypothetical protein